MSNKLLMSWAVSHPGEKSMSRGWSDLTLEEVKTLLSSIEAGTPMAHAFRVAGLSGVKTPFKALNLIKAYLEEPAVLKQEVADIVGSMSDGLTIRQIVSMNDCATAIGMLEMTLDGHSQSEIARHFGCLATDVAAIIGGLGYGSSINFSEASLTSLFKEMSEVGWQGCGTNATHARTAIRRANLPARDWGSVVVNNGFKVTDGKFEGEIAEVIKDNQHAEKKVWRVIPVSIPTLEEAVETILEWGCGL